MRWTKRGTLTAGLQTQIRTATKRGGGSSRNGRDSSGKRLGVKKFTSASSLFVHGRVRECEAVHGAKALLRVRGSARSEGAQDQQRRMSNTQMRVAS